MKQSYWLLALIALIYLLGTFVPDRWKSTLLFGDSNGYYMHVVSFFVNQDVGDYDQTISTLRETDSRTVDGREDPYGIRLTSKGRRYIKYTLGVAVMETPFFLVAHAYAKYSSKHKANGWSLPYLFAVSLSTLVYILLGFHLLFKSLRRYFSKGVTTLVLLGLALATNLFYHATSLTMAHGFLFFDYCLLIYLTIRFYEGPTVKKALALGATVGLIALTRVPEVVSVLIPLLWGITDWKTLKSRGQFLWNHYRLLLFATLSFIVVFAVQFVYWYYVSGQLIFNPYQGENFNFLDPHLLKGWFHFKNGWLIYTPFMAFSLLGWLLLRRYLPEAQLPVFAVVGLVAYIHYSYYVWAYFPGLGSRPMVETYPLLAFGLAAFFTFCSEKKWLSWLPIAALLFFSALNIFQTWQMNTGLIWTERGNYGFYWESFGMTQATIESLRAFDCAEVQPDSTQLTFVHTLASDNFEQNTNIPTDTTIARSGRFSFFPKTPTSPWKQERTLENAQAGDWLRIGIHAYMKASDKIWGRGNSPDLILEIYDDKQRLQKWTNLKIACHINQPEKKDYSIWYSGATDIWGEAAYFVRLPRKAKPTWSIKAFVLNNQQKKLYLDDFAIDLYRKK